MPFLKQRKVNWITFVVKECRVFSNKAIRKVGRRLSF